MARTAPGELALVQAFVNTRDLEDERDLGTPEELVAWLTEHGLVEAGAPSTSGDLLRALELRESIRDMLSANNGLPLDSEHQDKLDRCCDDLHVHMRVRFGRGDRPLFLEPEEGGVSGALGKLLAICFEAMLNGTWPRFKACAKHSCRWAFYDYSRNHSATWCSMQVCGNRVKVSRYRERAASSA